MTPTPKRRWPRFTLRTLFVVVTVFGCWMGYQLNWIRQRHVVLENNEVVISSVGFYWEGLPPWPLGWFGESG